MIPYILEEKNTCKRLSELLNQYVLKKNKEESQLKWHKKIKKIYMVEIIVLLFLIQLTCAQIFGILT